MQSIRSAPRRQRRGAGHRRLVEHLAEQHDVGLQRLGRSRSAARRRRPLEPRARLGERVASRRTLRHEAVRDRTVDLDHILRPGGGVQAVDVLRDDRDAELRQRAVRAVGLLALERREAVAVEAPEALRVAPPDGDVGDLHRVDVGPQPGARRAEVGDPGRDGDARPGEGDDRPRRADQLGEAGRASRGCFTAPLNSGLRFCRNAPMPSRASSEPNAVPKAAFSASIPSSRSPACETLLDLLERHRRLAGELARPGQRGVEQLVVGHQAVDEPELVGLLGADRVADRVHLERLGRADQPRQPLGAAEAGDDPEVDLGLAEGGAVGGQADVAGHRDLAAAAEREPVDRRDGHDPRLLPASGTARARGRAGPCRRPRPSA